MAILNYTTKVPVNRTIAEIQAKLVKAGAKGILCEYGDSGEPEQITFSINDPQGLIYFRLPANIQGVSKALTDATELSATYHTKNLEVISRMAKAMDYIVDTEETDDKEWTVFHFTKEKEIETKPKKFRPTVIQGGLK